MKDYSELKSHHTKSVIKLNNIFSSLTLLGLINAYFLTINFDTKFVGIFDYIEIGAFLIGEFMYIYSISRIKLSVFNNNCNNQFSKICFKIFIKGRIRRIFK